MPDAAHAEQLVATYLAKVTLGGYDAKFALKCPDHLTKEHSPNLYDPALKEPNSAFTELIMESGNVFEDRIGKLLTEVADHPEQVVVIVEERDEDGKRTTEGKQAKEAATFAAMTDEKVAVIFNARWASHFTRLWAAAHGVDGDTLDKSRVSEPDMLVKVDGTWFPVDIKDHATCSGETKPKPFTCSPLSDPTAQVTEGIELSGQLRLEDWMQLAHYWRHMQTLGVVPDDPRLAPWGAVIGREELLVWAHLDENRWFKDDPDTGRRKRMSALDIYDAAYEKARDIIARARVRNDHPDLDVVRTKPEWSTDAKESPWRTVFLEELRAFGDGGHITLLPGITPDRAKVHYAAGIDAIADLARLDVAAAKRIDAGDVLAGQVDATMCSYSESGIKDLAKAVYQARATYHGTVARAEDVDFVALTRAAIEIDFDCEADTARRGDPLVYMWGVRATGRAKKADGSYRQRVEQYTFDTYENTFDGELAVFVQTWQYFMSMRLLAKARKHSIRFYHYTRYERTQMLRLAAKYAGASQVPSVAEVEEFFDSPMVIDLYEVLHKQLVWPTLSHSIKELAKVTGFSWRDETPGGDMSLVWYADACNHADPLVRAANTTRLREYNEDDTHAQLWLRDWVSARGPQGRAGEKLPSVTTLHPPLPRRHRAA